MHPLSPALCPALCPQAGQQIRPHSNVSYYYLSNCALLQMHATWLKYCAGCLKLTREAASSGGNAQGRQGEPDATTAANFPSPACIMQSPTECTQGSS
jgi:hypothetical protein